MDVFAVFRAPVTPLKSFWALRSLFGTVHNLSIQIKASAASAVLLICLAPSIATALPEAVMGA